MMRKRNMHCLGNVWNTMASQSSCANSIFTRAIRYGFESSMNCIHTYRFGFAPFLYSDCWDFFASTHTHIHNKIKLECFLFALLFLDFHSSVFYFSFLSIGDIHVCVYVEQLVPYRLFALFIWQPFFVYFSLSFSLAAVRSSSVTVYDLPGNT